MKGDLTKNLKNNNLDRKCSTYIMLAQGSIKHPPARIRLRDYVE